MAEPTPTAILMELREGHAKINGRLDVGTAEMKHLRTDIQGLKDDVEKHGKVAKTASESVAKIRSEVDGGINAVRFLVWVGVPATLLAGLAAWLKNGGGS